MGAHLRRPTTTKPRSVGRALLRCGALALTGAALAAFAPSLERDHGIGPAPAAASNAICSAENVAAFIEQNGGKAVVDLERFYEEIQKERIFSSRYSKPGLHFEGTDAILKEWNANYALENTDMLAYILATSWHETGTRMYPIREAFAKTDEAAIRALDRHFASRTRNIYWRPVAETGRAYFGRGYVQLTWDFNYKKADTYLGIDKDAPNFKEISYYWEPNNALDPEASIKITYSGMFLGWYTNKCLFNYFQPNQRPDFVGARRIINGVDKKEKIAQEAAAFHRVLQKPGVVVPPDDLEERLARKKEAEEAAEAAAAEEEQRRLDEALDRAALKDTRDRLTDTERKVFELEERLTALLARADALERADTDAANERAELRETDLDQQAEIDALVDQNTALGNEIGVVRAALTAESRKLTALREENGALRTDLAATQTDLRSAEAANEAAQARMDELARQVRLANERTLWNFIFGGSPDDDG